MAHDVVVQLLKLQAIVLLFTFDSTFDKRLSINRIQDSPGRQSFQESGCLGMQPKRGGKPHLRLNTGERPIANKYREGKMKRSLKRR